MKRLSVTLEPWRYEGNTELRVIVEANGITYTDTHIFSDDAFHSLFERLMEQATITIKALVDKEKP